MLRERTELRELFYRVLRESDECSAPQDMTDEDCLAVADRLADALQARRTTEEFVDYDRPPLT